MKLIKQLLLTLLSSLALSSIYAQQTTVRFPLPNLGKTFSWEFQTLDDGMFFLLGPESTKKLEILVDVTASNGKSTDSITVNCNASVYHVAPGTVVTCYGNFNDVVSMFIAPEDFKNGSKGIYQYKSL